jgi:hypothetical protein
VPPDDGGAEVHKAGEGQGMDRAGRRFGFACLLAAAAALGNVTVAAPDGWAQGKPAKSKQAKPTEAAPAQRLAPEVDDSERSETRPAPGEGTPEASRSRDRHADYYYPSPETVEIYHARSVELPDMDRRRRILFVIGIVGQMQLQPYQPPFAIFPKGADAEKLIMVSNVEGQLNTLFRARAVLATLTAIARTLPILREFSVEDTFTFLDLCRMLGFKQVTVSDGDIFAHQILLR